MAEGLGLAQNWGVVIANVIPHGPADAGGIRADDIVLSVDGHPIVGLPGFTASLYQHPTDQVLKIDVLRRARKLSLDIPAVLAHDRIDRLAELADPVTSRIEPLGIFGLNFDEELRPALWNVRPGSGVIVVGQAPGFNSVDTRLQPGDLIHTLNGTPIESVEQLRSVVTQLKPGDAAVLRIERQGQFQYVVFEME